MFEVVERFAAHTPLVVRALGRRLPTHASEIVSTSDRMDVLVSTPGIFSKLLRKKVYKTSQVVVAEATALLCFGSHSSATLGVKKRNRCRALRASTMLK